ncbi:MAG: YggS family pyridoxal phosphate-dependent enzyme [Dehalococcoidia bacterium]|nr:YggS family pyridoxal phosphate-dependent enzyme [Chloroflexota bacterium]MCK4243187.1 YggS family pyridoxal phosphate-dependent enzyme [Dehalococcoidia bacterium]
MDIERNLRELERRIDRAAERAGRSPADITIVAVTKGVAVEAIEAAIKAGIRHIGENRVQEARAKIERLSTLELQPMWHMVGHLQTNKVKTAVQIFDIIHSINSLRLAEAVSQRAQAIIPVLLQVNVSGEGTRSGFSVAELPQAAEEIAHLPRLEVKGLMTIAPMVADTEEVRPIFQRLRQLRDELGLEHLSMGMTDDFEVAVEEGATMVRIGRAIFGQRR